MSALINEFGRRYLPRGVTEIDPARHAIMIDNYDSFTFNLVQYLLEAKVAVDVYRNDKVEAQAVLEAGASHLLLSPGPGRPEDSGVCQELCRRLVDSAQPLPTLGVCLGHQTLCEQLGATVERAGRIMHGKVSPVLHDGCGVFGGLPSPLTVTRYHSLIVDEVTLPASLEAVARTDSGELMAVRHRTLPIEGVQFHPESILTQQGHTMIENFVAQPGPGGSK